MNGYLLQYFVAQGIRCCSALNRAANVAAAAQQRGISTLVQFFGEGFAKQLVAQGTLADLIVGNNVLAHVPHLNDFVSGLKLLLKPHGVMTLEFPHLLRLMAEKQFDTIYRRAFFVLFPTHGVRRLCCPWPDALRCRRVAHPWWFLAHLRAA